MNNGTSDHNALGRRLTCTGCPMGCSLTVIAMEPFEVEGGACPRGKKHALQEVTDPRRVLTTTVRLRGGLLRRLPVRTSEAIPKDRLHECMRALAGVEVIAPIAVGDIALENALGLGVNVVATASASGRTPESG